MVALDQKRVSLLQQAIPQATDASLNSLLQSSLTAAQAKLGASQQLLANPNASVSIGSTPAPTGSSSLAASDQGTLQMVYSMSTADKYTAQLTALIDSQAPVPGLAGAVAPALAQYGMKLTADHVMVNHLLESVAFATNTPLQPTVPQDAIPAIQGLLSKVNGSGGQGLTSGTVKTSDYETTYLSDTVDMHTMLYNFETSTLPAIQDPNLKAVIQMDIPSVYLHRQGA